MKNVLCVFILTLLLCLQAEAFEAGAARVDITPRLGTPLAGYMARWGRGAIEVHDNLWARAVYLSDGETSVFLVSADLCVINPELRGRVLELAPAEVPVDHIILTATHNHSGHGGMVEDILIRPFTGRFMPDVLEATAQGFAEAMREAYANRRRAAIGFDTFTQQDLTVNRRDEDGPVDPQVGVIRIEDADGTAIAFITNMAAHPTTVWDDRMLSISADFPGFFNTELERLSDPGSVSLFLNGALGNQRPRSQGDLEGWERTASIGRTLAQRTIEVAESIECSQEPLRFAYTTASLPPTLVPDVLPDTTVLQMLEIGDLAMHFFPGEPCVELGLDLRTRSLDSGYTAQFSVGLANDHLFYFVPRSQYTESIYENEMSLYGPGMEDWFNRHFAQLASRTVPAEAYDIPPLPPLEEYPGGLFSALAGTPYQIGYQRGQVFREAIHRRYEDRVLGPIADGHGLPEEGWWTLASRFLNLDTIALWRLGYGARPLLAGLSETTFRELEGMADGAHLAFDGIWLSEVMPMLLGQDDPDFFELPYCTLFAAVGDRAGADDLLVGRNLDRPGDEPVTVLQITPTTGRQYLEIGFPGEIGIFTGMNNAGVVVAVETIEDSTTQSPDGPPIGYVLREVLAEADDFSEALTRIQGATHLSGLRVLVTGPDPEGTAMSVEGTARQVYSAAAIVEFGPEMHTRFPSDGLLYGTPVEVPDELKEEPEEDEEQAETDDEDRVVVVDSSPRYTRMHELLSDERIISSSEIMDALGDATADMAPDDRIYNEDTQFSAVFEPNSRRVLIRTRQPDGSRGETQVFTLDEFPAAQGGDVE